MDDNSTFICQTTNECSDDNKIFDQTGEERASPKQPARQKADLDSFNGNGPKDLDGSHLKEKI